MTNYTKGMPEISENIDIEKGLFGDFRKRHPKFMDRIEKAFILVFAISVVGISICVGIIWSLSK